jgi:hypothetical protein
VILENLKIGFEYSEHVLRICGGCSDRPQSLDQGFLLVYDLLCPLHVVRSLFDMR